MSSIRIVKHRPSFQNTLVPMIKSSLFSQKIGQLILFTGKPGFGKSWSAGRLCEAVDPDFTADNVVFTAEQFTRLIKSGKLKKGSAILFDEAGKDVGSRTFMRRDQIALMVFIQAMRKLRYMVCFTVPSSHMVDKQLRNLAHILCEAKTRNIAQGYVRFKVKINMFIKNKKGESIYRYPVVKWITENNKHKNNYRVISFMFTKPSRLFINEYEKVKDENIDRLADLIINTEKAKRGSKKSLQEIQKEVTRKVLRNIEKFKNSQGGCDWMRVKMSFPHVSDDRAKMVAKYVNDVTASARGEGK